MNMRVDSLSYLRLSTAKVDGFTKIAHYDHPDYSILDPHIL